MRQRGIDTSEKFARWATTIAAIKINENSFDWLQIGDSFIVTILRDGSFQLTSEYHDHGREILTKWQELAIKETQNIWEILQPEICKNKNEMNVAYGILDGEPEAKKFLRHYTIPLAQIAHILLLTDGLFLPKESPRQPEDFAALVGIFLEKGLQGLKDHVRAQEDSDPNYWKYPWVKKYDDIAAIALSF